MRPQSSCPLGRVNSTLFSQSFTIHGIWPDQVTTQSFGAFNYALIQKETKLLDDMHNYWPPKSKPSHSTTFLWSHEWTVHGKDYAAILFKLKPESFPGTIQQRNAALQVAFYKDVISFYQRFNGKKLSAGTMTRAAVASKLGVAESDIIFQCSSSNIIKSIQICLNITKSGLAPKACAKASSCSGTTVTLPSWRSKGQSRVTNYPAFFLST